MTTTTPTTTSQNEMSVENNTAKENYTGSEVLKKTEQQRTTFKISVIPGFVKNRIGVHHLLYIILIAKLHSILFWIG